MFFNWHTEYVKQIRGGAHMYLSSPTREYSQPFICIYLEQHCAIGEFTDVECFSQITASISELHLPIFKRERAAACRTKHYNLTKQTGA